MRFAFAVFGRMWYTCRMGEFKSIVARAVCVVVIALAGRFYAGDVVGVMRVDIATNGLVEVEMPFEPMENTGPSGFISGLFFGDGLDLSDRLFAAVLPRVF